MIVVLATFAKPLNYFPLWVGAFQLVLVTISISGAPCLVSRYFPSDTYGTRFGTRSHSR